MNISEGFSKTPNIYGLHHVLTNELFEIFDSIRVGLFYIDKLFGNSLNISIWLALKHHCYLPIVPGNPLLNCWCWSPSHTKYSATTHMKPKPNQASNCLWPQLNFSSGSHHSDHAFLLWPCFHTTSKQIHFLILEWNNMLFLRGYATKVGKFRSSQPVWTGLPV